MARNIGMELNLVVGEINCVLLSFIPQTFNTCIKTIEAVIELILCQY